MAHSGEPTDYSDAPKLICVQTYVQIISLHNYIPEIKNYGFGLDAAAASAAASAAAALQRLCFT